MATGQVKAFSLGLTGVVLDPNPLDPSTPDNALVRAQNATHEPTARHGAALRKRPGLKRMNTVVAGGAILGGIMVPVAGTGGAPVPSPSSLITGSSSGGGTGSAGSTGSGAPGSSTTAAGTEAGVVAGAFNATGVQTIFPNKQRLIAIGLADNTIANQSGEGWYLTTKGILDNAIKISPTPGPPGTPSVTIANPGEVFDGYQIARLGVKVGDYYYYSKAFPQFQTPFVSATNVKPSIRKTNGITDVLVATLPANLDAAHHSRAICSMALLSDGTIAIGVNQSFINGESESSNTGIKGRIYRLNPVNDTIAEVPVTTGPGNPGDVADTTDGGNSQWNNYIPLALADHGGRIVACGSVSRTADANNRDALVSAMPIDENWEGLAIPRPFFRAVCMAVYHGQLFIGMQMKAAVGGSPAIAFAQIWTKNLAGPTPAATSYNVSNNLTATGANAAQPLNGFISMVIFNDKLYASFYSNNADAKIYQFDGTSWTAVVVGASNRLVPWGLFVDQDTMYAIGVSSLGVNCALTTTDGTNWNDQTAKLSGVTGHSEFPASGLFFGFNQF